MSTVEVVEVESSGQLDQFIKYPNRLYRNDPNYVTPLISERREFFDEKKNPFFRTARVKLFLAMQGREIVGRVATCINFKHNDYHQEKVGFFGFFDTPDDWEVARSLLKVAMITLKQQGMDKMRGPMNFSTNHECGFLVEGYGSPPAVMMPYNLPYQVRLAEKFGLKKVMDLVAFVRTDAAGPPERISRIVGKIRDRARIKVRTMKMSDFDNEVRIVRNIYNAAWAPNWGFVPMDDVEFEHMARNLKQIVDPNIVLFAEHDGEPVAFSLALPDINQALIHLKGRLFPLGFPKLLWHTKIKNKVNRLRMITFGVIPKFQRIGVDSVLFMETFERGIALKYKEAELSWILETNELMCRGAVGMGAEPFKKYRIVEMPL